MERLVASELLNTSHGAPAGPSISQLKVMPFALIRAIYGCSCWNGNNLLDLLHIRPGPSIRGSVARKRVVFTTLDKYHAGRDFDALSDYEGPAADYIRSSRLVRRFTGSSETAQPEALECHGRHELIFRPSAGSGIR